MQQNPSLDITVSRCQYLCQLWFQCPINLNLNSSSNGILISMAESVNKSHRILNEKLLPLSSFTYKKLIGAYEQDLQDYVNIQNSIGSVLNDFKAEINEASSNMNEIIKKSGRDQDVKKKGDTFLTAKQEEIKMKSKNTESIISGLKEAVSKVKPDQLADLPVDKQRPLFNFFKMLYDVLYKETKQFNWKDFKKLALLHQNGEDFQSRMANINVYTLSQQQFKEVLKIQQDPQFQKLCDDPKFAEKMLDVCDWLEYVKAGCEFGRQKLQVEKQHDKIKKDIVKRELDIKQREESLRFWKETSSSLEEFQNNLEEIESRLKTIRIGVAMSIPKLKDNLTEAEKKTAEINAA